MTGRLPSGEEPRPSGAGFSLVEVVVALGLLAAVLISVSGLFVLANRQLDSGRNQSLALAVARDVLEEMDGWGFRQLYSTFGHDGSASSFAVDSRTDAYSAKWQSVLERELRDCYAEILIESVAEAGPGPALRDARVVRIQVSVHWSEGLRARSVRLSTVRV